jgi:hypothetical protein
LATVAMMPFRCVEEHCLGESYLKADPMPFLRSGSSNFVERDLWRTEELAAVYKAQHGVQPNPTALRKALRKAGFLETKRVRTRFGRIELWIIDNAERWRDASAPELSEAYEAGLPKGTKF